MSTLDLDRVIIAFTNDKMADWLKIMEGQTAIRLTSSVKVFISFHIKPEDYAKLNVLNIIKEIMATLVYNKAIRNSQQAVEICAEKVMGPKQELMIFLQKA